MILSGATKSPTYRAPRTCKTENPDRAKFCGECASPFVRRYLSCNAENPPTAVPLERGAMRAAAMLGDLLAIRRHGDRARIDFAGAKRVSAESLRESRPASHLIASPQQRNDLFATVSPLPDPLELGLKLAQLDLRVFTNRPSRYCEHSAISLLPPDLGEAEKIEASGSPPPSVSVA